LADSIRAVLSQALFKRIDIKGRIAVMEVLIATNAVRTLIRESKTHQIQSALQTGRKYGMQTLDEAIATYLEAGRISPAEAYMKCVDKEKFRPYLTEPPPDFTEV